MASYDRLRGLGEERFGKIMNMLLRGESAMGLAREIQAQPPKGWGLLQDVAETTLTQQLNRLRIQMAEGTFGPRLARRIAEGGTIKRTLNHVSIRVLDRLEELSEMQRDRVLALIEREKILPSTSGATNEVVEGYRKILQDLQKVRFDLGMDEFKGPMPGLSMKQASITFPDGMSVQKQVFEAVNQIEQIFDARRIPRLITQK